MPYCPFCGTPVKEQHKFCPNCGNPLEAVAQRQMPVPQAPQQQAAPAPVAYAPVQPTYTPQQPQGETIRLIIHNQNIPKSLGRVDTYYLIVTERRTIFAKLTNEIMNEAIRRRQTKAEAEGKGFFGKWKAQMQGFNNYSDYYANKTPDQALAETQGNWAMDNTAIRRIKFSDKDDDDGGQTVYYVEMETVTGKLKFKSDYDAKKLYETAYGSR